MRSELKPLQQEISDLLTDASEDRFSSPIEARKKAMDFLARREYGRAELTTKLIGKGFDPDVVEKAIARLADEGLQSDKRFADNFAQSRINQGKGPVRIRIELAQRGIDDAAVEIALDGLSADWHGLAREIREKKFGPARPADFKDKARQMRFLQYRGFEPEQVQAAMSGSDE
jgi:regulatory protein